MTETGADMRTITLEKGLATFLNTLSGKNRSGATIRAYQTDIHQFISFLHENNVSIHRARSQLSGQAASRARCDVAMRFNMFHRPAL